MRYFLDTEFEETGPNHPIRLISIGIVSEDGRELYCESSEVQTHRLGDWLQRNVVPHLLGGMSRETIFEISQRVLAFIPAKPYVPPDSAARPEPYVAPEFWGYFADYDWVAFCQLFGRMIDLPKGYPMFCMDLKQLAVHIGIPRDAFPTQEGIEHNALEDARWNKELYEFLMKCNWRK